VCDDHCVPTQSTLLERRLFYIPSFKIYGSVAGFYDYGPPGCAIKQNVTQVCMHDVLHHIMTVATLVLSQVHTCNGRGVSLVIACHNPDVALCDRHLLRNPLWQLLIAGEQRSTQLSCRIHMLFSG
jgi:hypothetical protein